MDSHVNDIYNYIQERCLWQFLSRSWDREESIDKVLGFATDLLVGKTPTVGTPIDKCHLADARLLVSDCRARFGWLAGFPADEVRAVFEAVKGRLVDMAITSSRNRELNQSLY